MWIIDNKRMRKELAEVLSAEGWTKEDIKKTVDATIKSFDLLSRFEREWFYNEIDKDINNSAKIRPSS